MGDWFISCQIGSGIIYIAGEACLTIDRAVISIL